MPFDQTIVDAKVKIMRADREDIAARVSKLQVNTDADYATASEELGTIKGRVKRINAIMDEFTLPFKNSIRDIKEQVARIDNVFLMEREPLKELAESLENKMVVFYRKKEEEAQRKAREAERIAAEEEAARQAALRKLQEDQEKAKSAKKKEEIAQQMQAIEEKPVVLVPVEEPKRTTRSTSGVTTMKKFWTFEVTDMVALAQYCKDSGKELVLPNNVAINKLIALGARDDELPGIRIYQDFNPSTRV